MQVLLLCVNVLLTSELAQLVNCERTDPGWKGFWSSYYKKKTNLADFIRRRDASVHDRMVATTLFTWLLNRSAGIHDVFDEYPLTSAVYFGGGRASSAYSEDTGETSPYRLNYSSSDSFAWLKMMRFTYDPFENSCLVHHTVKTFEYGFAYLGGYAMPVLTPLCDRVLLSMSAALALEAGCLLHTSGSTGDSGHIGKRTIARELATVAGVELVEFNCGVTVGFDQFSRALRGLLQSEACWLSVTGLEVTAVHDATRTLIRSFALEMNRLRDAIRAHQDTFPLDSEMVAVANRKLAIVVAARIHLSLPEHQELLLHLSNAFVPVHCVRPEQELVWEAMLRSCGMKNWKALSKALATLFLVMENHAEPFADASLSSLRVVFAVGRHIARQCATNRVKSEEKCVLVALLEVVRSRVLPARRIALLKLVRTVLPLAMTFEFTPLGMLAPCADAVASDANTPRDVNPPLSTSPLPLVGEAAEHRSDASVVGYDSDESEKRRQLSAVKDLFIASLTAKHLVPSESILRKLIELFHSASTHSVTVVVGAAMCGKSSAIDVLSCVWSAKSAEPLASALQQDGESGTDLTANQVKTVRLFPAAFRTSDVYGQVRSVMPSLAVQHTILSALV